MPSASQQAAALPVPSKANEPDDKWKAKMREKIEESLQDMVKEAKDTLDRSLRAAPVTVEERARLQAEYTAAMTNVRAVAAEAFQAELVRERQQRLWASGGSLHPEWAGALAQEQQGILDQAKREGPHDDEASPRTEREVAAHPGPSPSPTVHAPPPPPQPPQPYIPPTLSPLPPFPPQMPSPMRDDRDRIPIPSTRRGSDAFSSGSVPREDYMKSLPRRGTYGSMSERPGMPESWESWASQHPVMDEPEEMLRPPDRSRSTVDRSYHERSGDPRSQRSLADRRTAHSPPGAIPEIWKPSISPEEDAAASRPYVIGRRSSKSSIRSNNSANLRAPSTQPILERPDDNRERYDVERERERSHEVEATRYVGARRGSTASIRSNNSANFRVPSTHPIPERSDDDDHDGYSRVEHDRERLRDPDQSYVERTRERDRNGKSRADSRPYPPTEQDRNREEDESSNVDRERDRDRDRNGKRRADARPYPAVEQGRYKDDDEPSSAHSQPYSPGQYQSQRDDRSAYRSVASPSMRRPQEYEALPYPSPASAARPIVSKPSLSEVRNHHPEGRQTHSAEHPGSMSSTRPIDRHASSSSRTGRDPPPSIDTYSRHTENQPISTRGDARYAESQASYPDYDQSSEGPVNITRGYYPRPPESNKPGLLRENSYNRELPGERRSAEVEGPRARARYDQSYAGEFRGEVRYTEPDAYGPPYSRPPSSEPISVPKVYARDEHDYGRVGPRGWSPSIANPSDPQPFTRRSADQMARSWQQSFRSPGSNQGSYVDSEGHKFGGREDELYEQELDDGQEAELDLIAQRREEARKLEEDVKRKRQEAERIAEEARKKEEDIRRKEEEAERREELLRRKEEAFRRKEQEARKQAEEVKRKEEDLREKAEEARRKEEEARRLDEEARKNADEAKRKEDEAKRNADEARRKVDELKAKADETKKKEQEAKKKEQEVKKKEAEARRKEEEVRKKEKELRKKEEEARTREQEALAREEDALGREEEARLREEEANQREEEARIREAGVIRKEEEANRKAQILRQKEEETRRKEDEIRQREEEVRRREEELNRREAEARSKEEEKRNVEEARAKQEEEERQRREQEMLNQERERVHREEFLRQQEAERQRIEQAQQEEFRRRGEEIRRRAEERKRQDSVGADSAWGGPSYPSYPSTSPSNANKVPPQRSSSSSTASTGSTWSTSTKASSTASGQSTKPRAGSVNSGPSPSPAPPTSAPVSEADWARRQAEQAQEQQERFRREQERLESERQMRAQKDQDPNEVIKIFDHHERQWNRLATNNELRWESIPWPMYRRPAEPELITTSAISAYLNSPYFPDKDKSRSSPRDRIKEQIRKWHPDRFETKVLPKVVEDDREKVKEGAGTVVRGLNELLTRPSFS